MKTTMSKTLLVGDWVIITLITIGRIFRSSYQPSLVFDLGIAVLPYLLAWTIIGWVGQAYHCQLPARAFIKRSITLWISSVVIAQVIRAIVYFYVSKTILMPGGLVVELIETTIFFAMWRIAFKLVYQISTDPTKTKIKHAIWAGILTFCLFGILFALPFLYAVVRYSPSIYKIENSPVQEAALVFGAGLWSDGTPSSVLVERVRTAAALYHAKKVEYIVLSGGSQEVEAMFRIAQDFKVDERVLVLDKTGDRTIHSCQNMLGNHKFSNIAVVTQRFQLFRAMLICNSLGIPSIGVVSDISNSLPEVALRRYLREISATALAVLEIQLKKDRP